MEALNQGIFLFIAQVVRYVFFAGIAWLIFYKLWKSKYLHKRIKEAFPAAHHIRREILYSLSTFVIFSVVGMLIFVAEKHGFTTMYRHISDYGWPYFIFSVVFSIVLHDAYFYWTHRMMHHKSSFPYVHKVHHLSHNPSPWASFAFHPLEAVIESGIVPILVFTVPMHPIALLIFILYMTFLNVLGHLGFETFPGWFLKSRWSRWHNTSTHHNMHHGKVNCNYSLYFNHWDRWMNTNHASYQASFESVAGRKKLGVSEEPLVAESGITSGVAVGS